MKWPQEVKEFPDISKLNKGNKITKDYKVTPEIWNFIINALIYLKNTLGGE